MDTEDPGAQPAGPSAEDLQRLAEYASVLADAIEAALGPWVERSVERVHVQQLRRRPQQEVRDAAARAGVEASEEVGS